jgi:hypothetical protein
MAWQDIVITVGTLVFVVALIPALVSKDKPPVITSLISGITIIIYAVTFSTLGLWFSFAINMLSGSLWLILALQKARSKVRKRSSKL